DAAGSGGVLERLLDLAGLEAARADVRARRLPGDEHADALEVRLEAPLGRHHRVAPVVAEAGLLTADRADLGHRRPRIAADTPPARAQAVSQGHVRRGRGLSGPPRLRGD